VSRVGKRCNFQLPRNYKAGVLHFRICLEWAAPNWKGAYLSLRRWWEFQEDQKLVKHARSGRSRFVIHRTLWPEFINPLTLQLCSAHSRDQNARSASKAIENVLAMSKSEPLYLTRGPRNSSSRSKAKKCHQSLTPTSQTRQSTPQEHLTQFKARYLPKMPTQHYGPSTAHPPAPCTASRSLANSFTPSQPTTSSNLHPARKPKPTTSKAGLLCFHHTRTSQPPSKLPFLRSAPRNWAACIRTPHSCTRAWSSIFRAYGSCRKLCIVQGWCIKTRQQRAVWRLWRMK